MMNLPKLKQETTKPKIPNQDNVARMALGRVHTSAMVQWSA